MRRGDLGEPGGPSKACLRVQRPPVFAVPSAEDADPAHRAVLGVVEQDLHLTARVGGVALGVLVGEDQRALHLKILDDHRLAALGKGSRCRHGAVERARRDQPAEDAMVAQPRRIGGEDLRVVGDLAARGLVARTQ